LWRRFHPAVSAMLRRRLRTGTCVTLELSRESDAARICAAASGRS